MSISKKCIKVFTLYHVVKNIKILEDEFVNAALYAFGMLIHSCRFPKITKGHFLLSIKTRNYLRANLKIQKM